MWHIRFGDGDTSTTLGLRLRPGKGVLGKCTRQRLFAADLLAADEGVYGDSNRTVNVLCGTILGQTHLAEGFRDTHDGFKMTDLVCISTCSTHKRGSDLR